MGLIDSHTHLTFPELRNQVDETLARCAEAGVDEVITVGIDLSDGRAAVDLAMRHPTRVHAAAAFHPHEAAKVTEDDLAAMAQLWDHPKVVGLGEMGLDYHYDFADRSIQRAVFSRQLELADSRPEPLVVHCRKALDDTIEVLAAHGYRDRPVVFHCFTGTAEELSRISDHGWQVSFTGVVTFKKSDGLQKIAKAYPSNKVMLETDAPYLSPEPVRSKRPNEPAYLVHTARFLAELRGVPFDEFVEQTAGNTREFFAL
jgi:TatD DNase family protein